VGAPLVAVPVMLKNEAICVALVIVFSDCGELALVPKVVVPLT